MASPLTDAQRDDVRGVLPRGRRLRRHRLGDRDRRVVAVPDRHPRHALLGPRPRRSRRRSRSPTASTTRPRPSRSTGSAPTTSTTSTANVRGVSHVLDDGRRGAVRPAAAGQDARRHRGRHDGRRPPDGVVQGLPGRALVLHRARQHGGGLRRRPHDAPQGRDRLGRRRGRPGLQRLRRDRAAQLPADQDQRAAEPQRADRLRPAPGRPHHPDRPPRRRSACTTRRRARRRSSPTSGPRPCRSRSASTRTPRTASTARRSTTTSPPTSGCTSSTRRRPSPTSSSPTARSSRRPRRTRRRRSWRRPRPRGTRTSATSSSAASSSSRTRSGARLDLGSEQQIMKVAGQPAGVLPRRGRHRLRQAQQPVAGHGRRQPGRRHQRRRLRRRPTTCSPTSSRPSALTNATGGTFTLTFKGQTTAPLPFNATAAQVDTALEALSRSAPTASRSPAGR